MVKLRHITHPGPRHPERTRAVPCRATARSVTLRAGISLLDALAEHADAAWFDLSGLDTATLAFKRPAPASGDGHAAWYSATTTLAGARILQAGAHLGRRDAAAFAHIHGVWADNAGALHMGHLLAENTVLAMPADVEMFVLEGARMESTDDSETRFTLFQPVQTDDVANPNAVLATARPNALIDDALADIAHAMGLKSARVKGLGSLIGAEFVNGHSIGCYATEVLLTNGQLLPGGATLDAAVVGFDGPHATGTLTPHTNTICVTFELLLLQG